MISIQKNDKKEIARRYFPHLCDQYACNIMRLAVMKSEEYMDMILALDSVQEKEKP